MANCTYYLLKEIYKIKDGHLINDERLRKDIFEYIKNNDKYFLINLVPFGSWSDPVKWYDVDEDMQALSKVFRNTLFVLIGDGDEGVKWISYYCNNKVETVFGNMMFPDISDKFLVANKINKTKKEIEKCRIN